MKAVKLTHSTTYMVKSHEPTTTRSTELALPRIAPRAAPRTRRIPRTRHARRSARLSAV